MVKELDFFEKVQNPHMISWKKSKYFENTFRIRMHMPCVLLNAADFMFFYMQQTLRMLHRIVQLIWTHLAGNKFLYVWELIK